MGHWLAWSHVNSLLERQKVQRKCESEWARGLFHLFVYSSSAHNGWGWAKETGNQFRPLMWGPGPQLLEPSPDVSQGTHQRKLGLEAELGLEPRYSDMERGPLNHHAKHPPSRSACWICPELCFNNSEHLDNVFHSESDSLSTTGSFALLFHFSLAVTVG